MRNTLDYQQTSTLMTIFQHSTNNWKRSRWLCISTTSWWEWKKRKPSGTDVREYECYSEDDVNYYVYVCLYVVMLQSRWCQLLCVCMFTYVWRCGDDHVYVCVVVCEGVTMLIYWLTTHFDKVNHVDRGSLNCWKISKKEYTRSSCDR